MCVHIVCCVLGLIPCLVLLGMFKCTCVGCWGEREREREGGRLFRVAGFG